LGAWVRERNVVSPAEAARQLTSLPAGVFGIRERGMRPTERLPGKVLRDFAA
jgi:hypothetical protein